MILSVIFKSALEPGAETDHLGGLVACDTVHQSNDLCVPLRLLNVAESCLDAT